MRALVEACDPPTPFNSLLFLLPLPPSLLLAEGESKGKWMSGHQTTPPQPHTDPVQCVAVQRRVQTRACKQSQKECKQSQ